MQDSGASRRENAEVCLSSLRAKGSNPWSHKKEWIASLRPQLNNRAALSLVIARLDRRPSIPEAFMIVPKNRGVLDRLGQAGR
jgi:hypothetical protein